MKRKILSLLSMGIIFLTGCTIHVYEDVRPRPIRMYTGSFYWQWYYDSYNRPRIIRAIPPRPVIRRPLLIRPESIRHKEDPRRNTERTARRRTPTTN